MYFLLFYFLVFRYFIQTTACLRAASGITSPVNASGSSLWEAGGSSKILTLLAQDWVWGVPRALHTPSLFLLARHFSPWEHTVKLCLDSLNDEITPLSTVHSLPEAMVPSCTGPCRIYPSPSQRGLEIQVLEMCPHPWLIFLSNLVDSSVKKKDTGLGVTYARPSHHTGT